MKELMRMTAQRTQNGGPGLETPALRARRGEQLVSVYLRARELYEAGRNLGSALAFGRAKTLAETLSDPSVTARARFFEGASLHGAGRLHEALAVFAPSVAAVAEMGSDPWIYMAITRYVLIAVELPVPLHQIDRAIADTEGWLRMGARRDRESRLLLAKARLARARGRYQEALPLAQEALERSLREEYTYTVSTYMRTVVDLCLKLAQFGWANRYLDDWEVLERHFMKNKAIFTATARASLLRREGYINEAIESARRAVAIARDVEELPAHFAPLEALVRALLCTRHPQHARDFVAELLRLRHCPVGQVRFDVRLLAGDYHMARARQLAGLPAVDFERLNQEVEPIDACRSETSGRSRQLARRHYGRALAVGSRLDEALQCTTRARIIRRRLQVLGPVA